MNESDKAGEVKKQLSTLNLKHKENKQRKGKGNIQKCNVILKKSQKKKRIRNGNKMPTSLSSCCQVVPISKCVWKVFTFYLNAVWNSEFLFNSAPNWEPIKKNFLAQTDPHKDTETNM